MLEITVLYADDGVKVGYGEGSKLAAAIHHDVPHEEGEDDAAVAGQEGYEVEVGGVIERRHNTDIMERGGVALVVLYGIDEGVYDIGIAEHESGVVVGSLQEVVVISINACYHVASHAVAHKGQECGLLALGEIGARGEHHLEIACLVFELAEYHAPEEDVVIAFNIGYDAASVVLSPQCIRCGDIVGADMVLKGRQKS